MTDVKTLSVEKQLHGKELDFKRYSSVAYNFGVHNNWVWPEQSSTDSAHSPVEYQQLRSAKFTSKWPMIGHLHLFFLEQECLYIWLIACNFRQIFVGDIQKSATKEEHSHFIPAGPIFDVSSARGKFRCKFAQVKNSRFLKFSSNINNNVLN